ncbi:hypothetical protein UFOVP1639_1, partial [uncultured Caudovirales phage]
TIFDALTGETITRDMNAAELAQSQADKLQTDKDAETLAKDQADKAATRAAVLTRLGLSSDELLALLS